MSYKPLTLFEILDSPINSSSLASIEMQLYGDIRKIEHDLDIAEETNISELPSKEAEQIAKTMDAIKDIQGAQSKFSTMYKRSIERLIESNKGMPVHINAFDIHDHNIDVDNIVNTYKAVIEEDDDIPLIDGDGSLLDFFTDNSHPVFATAPYNICVVQLQSRTTYGTTMGKVMNDDIRRLMKKERLGRDYGIETDEDFERFNEKYSQFESIADDEDRWCETFAIVQQYSIDEYIDYLHLGGSFKNQKNDYWGFDIKDTIVGTDKFDFGFDYDGDEIDILEFLQKEDAKFISVVDLINKVNDDIFYEGTILNFYDKHGAPKTARKWDCFGADDESEDMTHSDMFNITALEKVFQWWNSDNDLLEVGNVPITPSVKKRLKKYNKKRTNKRSIVYKTLVVRPNLKVVDENGVERTPSIREIAQHTRRGHWAHYGINGKGKLFGKYTKSVYRKPKTIGKLSSGLVLKDYELQDN